jgi:preprotein translocase subunit SecE
MLVPADIFPRGGGPVADVFAIALSVALFALIFWAIDLIDRI